MILPGFGPGPGAGPGPGRGPGPGPGPGGTANNVVLISSSDVNRAGISFLFTEDPRIHMVNLNSS